MAKSLQYLDRMLARFPTGTFGRIEAVLGEGEDRTEFVRSAVERELIRREHDAYYGANDVPTTTPLTVDESGLCRPVTTADVHRWERVSKRYYALVEKLRDIGREELS